VPQESLWARHSKQSKFLWEGLKKLGLEPFVENPDDRLVTVNTIKVAIPSPHPPPLERYPTRQYPEFCASFPCSDVTSN